MTGPVLVSLAMVQSGVVVNILDFPFSSRLDLPLSPASGGILVGSPVSLTFFDKSLFNECVEIRIEPTVVDLFFVVILEFVFDCEPVWVIEAGNYVQQVALKAREIIHTPPNVFKF